MTLRRAGTRPRERWALLAAVVAGLILALASMVFGTNIGGFEIDAGEGGGLVGYYSGNDPSTAGDDWTYGVGSTEGVFIGSPDGDCYNSTITVNSNIVGAAAAICDGTSDPGFKSLEPENSIVSPSGKTPDDVWPIKPGNNTPKNDVTHGYTLIREFDSPCVAGSGPDSLIVYLGGERLNNEGDSFWGFELDQVAPDNFDKLTANGGGGDGSQFDLDFNRSLGDVLVSVSLQKGGTVPTIEVYEVSGFNPDGSAIFTLAPTTCGTGNTPVSQGQTNAMTDATAPPWNVLVCDPSGTNSSNKCRLVNANQTDNAVPPRDFIEVAVDLGQYGISPACFNNVLFTSRSSSSVTADLKDVGGGRVPLCDVSVGTEIHEGTSASDVTDEPNIDGGQIYVGQTIHDKAIVSATGIGPNAPAPTGTITFKRYANSDCSGTTYVSETVSLGSDGTAESSDFTTTTSGYVSYLASYSGDGDYPAKTAACESVQVQKRNSTTVTHIHEGSSSDSSHDTTDIQGNTVVAGTIVHDQAVVTDDSTTGPTPAGNVLFKRFSTIDCTGSHTDETVALDGSAEAETSNFTTVDGFLSYTATYQGNSYYNASSESGCEPLTAITPSTILDMQASATISVQVTFTVKEKNDGSVPLTDPGTNAYIQGLACDTGPTYVSGDNGGGSSDSSLVNNGVLDPNEIWVWSCVKTYTTTGTFAQTATGHGIDTLGLDVTWCEDSSSPPTGVRCDQDETDTNSVTISVSVDNGDDNGLFP